MRIAIEVTVRAPLARVWSVWTTPDDIMAWNAASDDWHCPHAEAPFAVGGRFSCRMEARDGPSASTLKGPSRRLRRASASTACWMMSGG